MSNITLPHILPPPMSGKLPSAPVVPVKPPGPPPAVQSCWMMGWEIISTLLCFTLPHIFPPTVIIKGGLDVKNRWCIILIYVRPNQE